MAKIKKSKIQWLIIKLQEMKLKAFSGYAKDAYQYCINELYSIKDEHGEENEIPKLYTEQEMIVFGKFAKNFYNPSNNVKYVFKQWVDKLKKKG